MKIKPYLYVIMLLHVSNVMAQRIRKDHKEMTPSEKTAYVNALIVLRNNGTLASMASHHGSHFNTPIHSSGTMNGEFFLPWHRMYQFQMENRIRGVASVPEAGYLCVPYWDWRLENTSATVTWDDPGFLQLNAINTSSYTITRNFSTVTLANATDINNLLAIPTLLPVPPSPGLKSITVNRFSYRSESWHDRGHNFIGGTMGGSTSPRDPIFYLHHGFIDKLWQDWYDSDNGVVKTAFTFSTPASTYWMDWPSVSPNQINDSRYMKYQNGTAAPVTNEEVWYAYNKKLVLDGFSGIPFNVTGTNRLYCYTAWNGASINGEIFAGDVKRDASNNIVPDNRGGMKIKQGATCAFNAGSSVTMLPGFEAEYGAVFEANVVSLPCGFNSLQPQGIIADIAEVDDSNNQSQLYVYAESHRNSITVNYVIQARSKVILQFFNLMGQIIYSVDLGDQVAGNYQNNFTLPLASGIYFCRLITGNNQQSVKFAY